MSSASESDPRVRGKSPCIPLLRKGEDGCHRQPTLFIAGVLILIAAALALAWLAVAITGVNILEGAVKSHAVLFLVPLPFIGLAIGFGGNVALSNVLAGVFLMAILVAIGGGIFALLGRKRPALAGAGAAFLCVPLLGILAILSTLASRHVRLNR